VHLSRRNLIASTFLLSAVPAASSHSLKILFTGGHPGDPECGCAGTISRYTALGHSVVILYLNRGEGFCNNGTKESPAECAAIRTAEAQKACQILHARSAIFATQIDGRAIIDNAHYEAFHTLLDSEKPDILFTQWPIDRHRDHRAISQMTLDSWLTSGRKAAFYYYEVADDTMMFSPTEFVDISSPSVESLRHAACYAHASQQPDKWYPHQVELTRFRGSQSGHLQAEGFLSHWQSAPGLLP